ncbi:ABC transporter permease [Corynebacterium sp. AOP40-9SA-29]|uniref:ABC transporter permease n=1 Tax=Corynebacterium sp. AOP40-9SA-29 TaxID=3457677 RepID=UPI004034C759
MTTTLARPVNRAVAVPRPAPGLVLAGAVVVVVLACAVLPGLFTSQDPLVGEPLHRLQAPGPGHLFGTDHLGRDLWSRVVHGTRGSVTAAALAVLVAAVVGSIIGTVSAYVGGAVDTLLSRFTDVLQSIPNLLLSVAVVAGLGFGTGKVAVAVGVASVPTFVRVARNEVLRWRTSAFVEAAQLSGVGPVRILWRHIIPREVGPLAGLAVLEFGTALLSVSALGFLGLGAPPPTPEWGLLVADGRSYLASAWWLSTLPGLVIAVTVFSVNHLSHHIRSTS